MEILIKKSNYLPPAGRRGFFFFNIFIVYLLITGTIPLLAETINRPTELTFVKNFPGPSEQDVYFKSVACVDLDSKGNLYAFDLNNHHFVYKMNPSGQLIKTIGRRGVGPGDLYRPNAMKIHGDRFIVRDQRGFSFFDTEGSFKYRFRTFKNIRSFDVHGNKLFVLTENSDALVTVYSSKGKKLNAFGKRYSTPNCNGSEKLRAYVAPLANQGKILCGPDHLFFISDTLGEIHKFKYDGTLVFKKPIPGLETELIKKNRAALLETRPKSIPFSIFVLFHNVAYLNNKIYMTFPSGDSFYENLFVYNAEDMSIAKKYFFRHLEEDKKKRFSSWYFAVEQKGDEDIFYISLVSDGSLDVSINQYKGRR